MIKMVTFLMMSPKMATLDFLKINVSSNKVYDVINLNHGVTRKILSHDSNYVLDLNIWPKFGNSSISVKEVMVTSFL